MTGQVGLVLGAGGPTGGPFIHAALDELQRATGWSASTSTRIVGTSAGAFVAASIDPPTASPTDDQLVALGALANGHEYAPSARHVALSSLRRFAGVVIAKFAPRSRPFADYRVPAAPYHPGADVVTVERGSARRVVHRLCATDDAEAVVRASAAIPGVNQPVELDGRDHVDGAVHSATNVDVVDHHAHDVLVVIAPMVSSTGGSIVARFDRAQLRRQLGPWLQAGKTIVVVMPDEAEHASRRDRAEFQGAGRRAVERLAE